MTAGSQRTLFQFGYRRSSDQDARRPAHHPVIVVGAGPVGLTLALDLAQRGVKVVLLDDADRIGEGSRGICHAKRTLEIWDRLGVAAPMLDKGVMWQKGRVFLADAEVYEFDLLPEGGHKMPAFINLQQYYVEKYLVEAIAGRDDVDLRWRNKVTGIEPRNDGAIVAVATPDGHYSLSCEWLLCCDGARSDCRTLLGLNFKGEAFPDQFLIADVKMTAPFPTERRFWFDPPFHAGQSALLHRQPDNVWRIDLQLGPGADTGDERRPERVMPRIARMLGHTDFELEWVSIYTFQCRRIDRFVHGPVIFAGDAAHQVSPFGARGGNSGVQDAENLAWKLAAVIRGEAPPSLLDSYDLERGQAADENIAHSTRSTDFIAPRSAVERHFRNAVLHLAGRAEFAKQFVNSGRLSTATAYETPLSTPDRDKFIGTARLGAPLPDAPVRGPAARGPWLLQNLGSGPTVLHFAGSAPSPAEGAAKSLVIGRDLIDEDGVLAKRLDASPGATYVVRPDQHLCARFRTADTTEINRALARAMGWG